MRYCNRLEAAVTRLLNVFSEDSRFADGSVILANPDGPERLCGSQLRIEPVGNGSVRVCLLGRLDTVKNRTDHAFTFHQTPGGWIPLSMATCTVRTRTFAEVAGHGVTEVDDEGAQRAAELAEGKLAQAVEEWYLPYHEKKTKGE